MGVVVGVASQFFPAIITKPRIFIPIGAVCELTATPCPAVFHTTDAVVIIVAEILQIYSDGGAGMDYWRYCFPAFVVGASGAVMVFYGSAINVVTYAPPEMSGVIGAWTQVVAQVGAAVVLAVQAGFEGSGGEGGAHGGDFMQSGIAVGGLKNIVPQEVLAEQWHATAAKTFWFQIAWTAVLAIQFVVLYKTPEGPEAEHEKTRQRIRESGKEVGVPEA